MKRLSPSFRILRHVVLMVVALVLLSILPANLGFFFSGPLLGFASWHAYRGSVRCSD